MKCPKCQYIGFDSGDRCRNCGYEFSLSLDGSETPEDLAIQSPDEAVGPFADFSLNETPNLPLFRPDADSDAPLVSARMTPRAPLAVRRAAPVQPRPRPRRDAPPPEPRLALDTADLTGVYASESAAESVEEPSAAAPVSGAAGAVASHGARMVAGLLDLLLVGGIDLAVLYFTLRICDLTFDDVRALPVAPLIAFLVLLNGGYLSTFIAASGQTIGKMAAGIRVVPADLAAPRTHRVSFGQSVVRPGGYLVSAMPLGLGFVPAFVGADRRALHDRLADTRVVKA